MPKRIIFCADGTWNGPPEETGVSALDEADTHGELGEAAVTNVVKLFANLDGHVTPETIALRNEQERMLADPSGAPIQVAKYIHGVGDSNNAALKLLGGAFGVGVINRIVRGFTFISRQYAAGDQIHVVGFSRGAYTARALAGMIAQVGLLNATTYDPNDRREAYRLGIAAWCRAKRATVAAGALSRAGQALLALLEDIVAARLDERNLVPNVGMASVAVWDTVGSMGIPEYTDAGRSDILRFTDTSLSTKVARGFHAMAIDELRVDFPVTKWTPREGIEQVWFVGAHCDVGGGYTPAESYLSDIGLGWMMRKLASVDVTFAVPLPYTPKPAVLGGPFHTPWTAPPFNLMERVARRVEPTDVLHATVRARWNAAGAEPPYRPTSMGGFGDGIASARIDETAFA